MTVTPASYFCDGLQCVAWGVPEQRNPITGTFSKPAYRLIVIIDGRFYCSGTYGTVAVFNRSGAQVEERGFTLQDPSDCGEDNITCCAVDTLLFPGGIGHVVVSPPQPWGDIGANYTYWFDTTRAPTVDSCFTTDELLNQRAMRDMLRAAWDSANAMDIPSNRRELKVWLFEDSTGALVYGLYRDPTRDTPCASFGSPHSLPGVPVAAGHPHPFAPGDTLPANCYAAPLRPGQFRLYDTRKYGGASDSDLVAFRNDSLPGYVIDEDTIYAYPVGVTRRNAKSLVRKYPRVDAATGCILP
jgi:hypothetical protein